MHRRRRRPVDTPAGPPAGPIDHDEIDRVLRLKRLSQPQACVPCRQRKVKCDQSEPCRTCIKRGHPQICIYASTSPRRRVARPAPNHTEGEAAATVIESGELGHGISDQDQTITGAEGELSPSIVPAILGQTVSRSIPTASLAGQASHDDQASVPSNEISQEQLYTGDNFMLSVLHRTQGAPREVADDAGPVLGLQNTFDTFPFMDARSPAERWAVLLRVLPTKDEILTFFPIYRHNTYPFNPIIVEIDQFECDIFKYLEAVSSGCFQDPGQISPEWSKETSTAHIAILLGALASGAHFSMLDASRRSDLCLDFVRRAFEALRLANYLFHPSLDTVQALLILGNALQNMGQSNGAWALLGTTIRLGQTLGLHTESIRVRPGDIGRKARAVWASIVWQDCFLSLCHGRQPTVTNKSWDPENPDSDPGAYLSYRGVLRGLHRVWLHVSSRDAPLDLPLSERMVREMDQDYARAELHLRSRAKCQGVQQHYEYLALRMHRSFNIAILCRPAIQPATQFEDSPQYQAIKERARESLVDNLKAFLDFQAVSIIPLRTWSTVHAVLSSTLVLCLWEETRDDPGCRELQDRIIKTFLSVGQSSPGTDIQENLGGNTQWLSDRHARAFVALQRAVQRGRNPLQDDLQGNKKADQGPEAHWRWIMAKDPFEPALADGLEASGDFASLFEHSSNNEGDALFDWDAMDLSPFSYLDMIMK